MPHRDQELLQQLYPKQEQLDGQSITKIKPTQQPEISLDSPHSPLSVTSHPAEASAQKGEFPLNCFCDRNGNGTG